MKRTLLTTWILFLVLCVLYCLYLSRPVYNSRVNRNVHYYYMNKTTNSSSNVSTEKDSQSWQDSSIDYNTIVARVHPVFTKENDLQITSHSSPLIKFQSAPNTPDDDAAIINFEYKCSDFKGTLVHVAMVMAPNDISLSLHLLIKSLLVNRHSPLHLHVLTVDTVAMTTVRTLLSTWIIPSFKYTLYSARNITDKIPWINVESLPVPTLQLFFQVLIPPSVKQFIVFDIDALVIGDIGKLWAYLGKQDKATGITASHLNSKVNLHKRLATSSFLQTLNRSKVKNLSLASMPVGITDMIDAFSLSPLIVPCEVEECRKKVTVQQLRPDASLQYKKTHTAIWYDGELLHNIYLKCDEKVSGEKKQLQVSNRHYCSDIFLIASYAYRTLLYFFGRPYSPNGDHDVTLVTQASYDRISRLPILLSHWSGPVSIAIYVADSELERLYSTLNDSDIIAERAKQNLAIHIVFRHSTVYPINYVRNVALNAVRTPFVFLNDFDLQPNFGCYQSIQKAIVDQEMNTHDRLALVVPAFETTNKETVFPKSKEEMVQLMKKRKARQFHIAAWAKGHAPTQYFKWMTAKKPYTVSYKPQYEPYVVVRRDVVRYDTRFVGYGWNKVSHLMELHVQGYRFIVLPNVFVVHLWHPSSLQRMKYFLNRQFQSCLHKQEHEFSEYLNSKYSL